MKLSGKTKGEVSFFDGLKNEGGNVRDLLWQM